MRSGEREVILPPTDILETFLVIISWVAGRNPSEEMEWPSWSTKESEMQYLDAISKMTE